MREYARLTILNRARARMQIALQRSGRCTGWGFNRYTWSGGRPGTPGTYLTGTHFGGVEQAVPRING